MPWSRPTLDTIYHRIKADMESRLTGGAALLRRAVLRVLAKVFAGAIHLCYGYLEWVAAQLFVDTAETDYLNRHGSVWGIPRKAATFASGSVYFTGTDGTLIPAGTRIQNSDGDEYETLANTTIAGTISPTVLAQSLVPGETSNSTSNNVELVSPIVGVSSVVAVSGFSGGQDLETDDDYRQRILARIQQPPMGGTAVDYEFWAEEVSGVDKAWCFPRAGGDGTVGVVIKATGSNPVPSDSLRSSVYEWIFAKMPIGATLINNATRRVDSIVAVDTVIFVNITPYTTTRVTAVQQSLEALFDEQAKPGSPMLISLVRDAIANTGVDNYEITRITLNGFEQNVNADIPYVGYEYGTLTGVHVSAM